MAKPQEDTKISPNMLKHLAYLNCLSQTLTFKFEQGLSVRAQAGYKGRIQLLIALTILVGNAGQAPDQIWHVFKSDLVMFLMLHTTPRSSKSLGNRNKKTKHDHKQ